MRRPRNVKGVRRWISTAVSCSTDINGSMHRFGGPAAEYSNGHKQWFWKGKLRYVEVVTGNTTETENWPGRYERTETKDHSYGETCVFKGYVKLLDPDEFKFPGYEKEA